MKKFKICVYAITKNEEQFVERWLKSMSEADLIVVADTGSTDGTVKKLREGGALVYEEKIVPWRFDAARNLSLSKVPGDVDICLCTDLDELLSAGWREQIENSWTEHTTMGQYLYTWSTKADGSPDVQFFYTKMHNRHGYFWKYPVHEVLKPKVMSKHIITKIDNIELTHYPDHTKSRSNYIDLLELGVRENNQDDRMMYYLGREYKFNKNWQKCIDTQKKYLQLKSAVWKYERCAAMRDIALSYENLKNYEKCKKWYILAIAETPDMREPYIELAKTAYNYKDWQTCFAFAEQALAIKHRNYNYISLGYAWDYTPYDLASIAAYYLGYLEISKKRAEQALEKAPNDERLRGNLVYIIQK